MKNASGVARGLCDIEHKEEIDQVALRTRKKSSCIYDNKTPLPMPRNVRSRTEARPRAA
jgi:hypothetical protein